jgi:hypothetical protein
VAGERTERVVRYIADTQFDQKLRAGSFAEIKLVGDVPKLRDAEPQIGRRVVVFRGWFSGPTYIGMGSLSETKRASADVDLKLVSQQSLFMRTER